MGFTLAWRILGIVLVTLGGQTSFAQIDCPFFARNIKVSASFDTTITSPNYPLNYANDERCRWQINTESGYVIKVTFNYFSLEPDEASSKTRCAHDSLEFHHGDGFFPNLVGKYCGKIHPEVIYSTGQEMYVQFKSDDRLTLKGFNISVSAVKAVESYGMCHVTVGASKVYWPNGSSGMLYTPLYPIPYPGNTNCLWTITVPVGKRVKLTFEDFELEKSSVYTGYSYCKNDENIDVQRDYVEIRDGPWSSGKELGIYCGNKLDFEFYSTGHQMWINFHSTPNGSRQSKGFKAHFEAVEPIVSEELCLPGNSNNANVQLTGLDGALESPLVYYPPGLNCDWLITVPQENTVELCFDRFELDRDGTTGTCKGDYVDITDGQDSNSKNLGKFCGFTSPGTIRSSGRYMRVRFRSDSEGPVHGGFKATFSAVKETKSSPTLFVLAIVILSVVILIVLLVGCILYLVKHRKAPNYEAVATIPMSEITTSGPPTTHAGITVQAPQVPEQLAENSYSTPEVGYALAPTDPLLSPSSIANASEEPPPYSGLVITKG